MRTIILLSLAILATPLAAEEAAVQPDQKVSEQQLRADVAALVSFGTRHTLSVQDDPKRGIGAARRWGAAQFRKYGAACGGCLTIVLPERMVQGNRVPKPTNLVDVVAIQPGTERPNEVVIVEGHIDSRVTDVMNATDNAPGANDDGSGTALVLEAARVLSQYKHPATIVYALVSGEEQGLYGSQLLADYAQEHGWTVKAVFNNDIVGNSCGSDGYCDAEHVRVFSEGPRADLDDAGRAAQRRDGGENDSPSRNLSRWLDNLAGGIEGGLDVRQVWRADRMGRGGDHLPFLAKGYPAVRFTVAVENFDHQHQDLRTENGIEYGDTEKFMDFAYLAKVTRLNVRGLDLLARTPLPPTPVAEAAVQTYTTIKWNEVPGAVDYTIWHRRTDEPYWEPEPVIAHVVATSAKLEGVRGDDWIFGVSANSAEHISSPIASAVPGGGFVPFGSDKGDGK
jgi:hypothetical protein